MARTFQTGFEGGSKEVCVSTNASVTVSAAVTRGTWSGYSLDITGAPSAADVAVIPLGGSFSEFYFGLGFWLQAFNADLQFGGNNDVAFHWTAGGLLTAGGPTDGAAFGTGITAISLGTWHYLEAYIKIAGAGGRCTAKMDGIQQFDFTGDTLYVATAVDAMQFSSSFDYLDDVVV